jgi:predicted HicB family RNase H-like nuclease
VQDALRAQSGKPGPRPRHENAARLMVTIDVDTLERAQQLAERAGVKLSEWVEQCLINGEKRS